MAIRLPAQETIYISELLDLVNKAEDRDNQKELLSQYSNRDELHHRTLNALVELLLHPDIKWGVPEGVPPYTPSSSYIGTAPASLFTVFKNLSRVLEGGSNYLHNQQRRELYFIQVLESLAKEEAQLLCEIKDRDLKSYPNVSLTLFTELFPNLLPESVIASVAVDEVKKPNTPVKTGLENSSTDVKKKAGRPKKSTK